MGALENIKKLTQEAIQQLEEGFTVCSRCGWEDETKDLDVLIWLNKILDEVKSISNLGSIGLKIAKEHKSAVLVVGNDVPGIDYSGLLLREIPLIHLAEPIAEGEPPKPVKNKPHHKKKENRGSIKNAC